MQGHKRVEVVALIHGGLLAFLSACATEPVDEEPLISEPATIETFAGANNATPGYADGSLADARFSMPEGLVLDGPRDALYVADTLNHAIRKIDLNGGVVSTVAGVGTKHGSSDTESWAQPALLNVPRNLALSPDGDTLYFTDTGNFVIRALDLTSGAVSTRWGLAGQPGAVDGVGTEARFGAGSFQPWGGGIVIDASGLVMYVADSANQTIRAIDLETDEVTTIAGEKETAGALDGPAEAALFNKPSGVALVGRTLYIAEANSVDIRALDLDAKTVTTVAGKAPADPAQFCENVSLVIPPECGHVDAAVGTDARFRFPFGLSVGPDDSLFVVDSHNNLVRRFDTKTTAVSTSAGSQATVLDDVPRPSTDSSPGAAGTFSHPTHAVFAPPDSLYVADRSANCIRLATMNQ
jgi:sugar lactone lactonase YvrE